MKKIISISFILFSVTLLHAQTRSLKQAKEFACDYLKHRNYTAGNILSERLLVKNALGQETAIIETTVNETLAPFYILTDSLDASFYIIISGDERMKPVLAYGKNGNGKGIWNKKILPDGLIYLLECYKQQYELLQTTNIQKNEKPNSIIIPDVEPLLETKWSQESPFNNLCPDNCPSGCVATAMSQVMKYYQFPNTGFGSFSYTSATKKYRCKYDFSTANFDWSNMKKYYSTADLFTENANDIAQVTYACGVSVGMDYNMSGSGAYMGDVPYALIQFFGYNKNVSFRDRAYYDATEWYQMLCEELSSGRPVIYGGVDSKSGGHAFVIDGCDNETNKFHINWGWGGSFDGYYEIDALDPQSYKFTSYHNMTMNISPDVVGTHQDIFYADKFSTTADIKIGENVTFTINEVYCFSSQSSYVVSNAKFYGTIGVGIFDEDFNLVTIINKSEIDGINNFYGYSKLTFTSKILKSMFPENGTYYVAPFVQEISSESPTRIRTSGGKTDYFVITVDGEDIENDVINDDDNQDVVSTWNEDFEYITIPAGWTQKMISGNSEWKHQYVLVSSDNIPMAANGKGYMYLDYSDNIMDLYNTQTVTRLNTNIIPLTEENVYNLSVQYRKKATMPESADLLTIYYEKDNEWFILTEIPIKNQNEWNKAIVELPVSGNIKLAFEGSVSKGSTVYIDDIKLYKTEDETTWINKNVAIDGQDEKIKIYNLAGVLVSETVKSNEWKNKLPKGTYIIYSPNQTRKIQIKK